MPPMPLMMPIGFGIELVYTLTVIVLCTLLYLKTREIYKLSEHKGIKFFRYAFMFFGLAYASRLFLYIVVVGNILLFEPFMRPRHMEIMPVSNLVMAYLSTMAILYLTYSIVWKRFNMEQFLTFSNIIALLVAVIGFLSRSHIIVSLVQLLLIATTIIISLVSYYKAKKDKKKKHSKHSMHTFYFLIAIFWLISLFILNNPTRFIPLEIKIILQLISLSIFVWIYYKATKLIR